MKNIEIVKNSLEDKTIKEIREIKKYFSFDNKRLRIYNL
jgi:hypothetical protein